MTGSTTTHQEWTSQNSDPARFNWMAGSPPPDDRIIRFADGTYHQFPQWRWSVCHFEQLMPTKRVSRGLSAPVSLPINIVDDLDTVTFMPLGQAVPMTWEEAFDVNFTDGLIVLHHGKIVYERYAGALTPGGRHAAMSLTKSFVGLLGELLVEEGKLDEIRAIQVYIPELSHSAFGDATVRQVLDMTTSLDYSEDYADPEAEIWQHTAAGNPLPKPEDYTGPQTYYEYLQTIKKLGDHGMAFGYKTVNTDTL